VFFSGGNLHLFQKTPQTDHQLTMKRIGMRQITGSVAPYDDRIIAS